MTIDFISSNSISDIAVQEIIEYASDNIKYMAVTHCHFAMIYIQKGKTIKPLSFGYNHLNKEFSIHAEVDAINNLPPATRKKKKLVKAKLIVIRVSRGKMKLAKSRCCIRCCEAIYKLPPLRGYTITNVAFSCKDGTIEDHHPISLLLEDDYHMSIYYTRRKYKPKIRQQVIENPTPKTKLFMMKKIYEVIDD